MPAGDLRGLFLAVFLLFAPMPALVMAAPQQPFAPAYVLASALLGGLIAVGWAAVFVLQRFAWLLAVIPLSALVPMGANFGLHALGLRPAVSVERAADVRTVYMVLTIASVVAGYVLLVTVIRRFERVSERSRAELEIASRVHAFLVPRADLRLAEAEVFGRSTPSSEMGGDLIDVVPGGRADANAARQRLDVVLADVSGHGVGAGIVMAMLKSSLRTRLLRAGELREVVGDANRALTDLTEPSMFATMAAVRLGAPGEVEYALAGHLPILHYRAGARSWTQYDNQNLPLGIDADEVFITGRARVEPGDLLFMITDGLTEVRDAAGRELTLEGVTAIIERVASTAGPETPLAELDEQIGRSVREHGPASDDQSIVIVRVRR